MKALALLAILGTVAFVGLRKHTVDLPSTQVVAAMQPGEQIRSERLLFGGRIAQHVSGGLLMHCTQFIRELPPGYELNDIQGDFLLVGHPGAKNLADGAPLQFEAHQGGLHTFATLFGGTRSIRKVYYAEAAPPAKPADWMARKGGTMLDQKPR